MTVWVSGGRTYECSQRSVKHDSIAITATRYPLLFVYMHVLKSAHDQVDMGVDREG